MGDFRIGFDAARRPDDPLLSYGRIKIGSHEERLEIDLSYWRPSDYERHWREGVHRLVKGGASSSCLISSMRDPARANFIVWWPLYRVGESVVMVQNQILFLEELSGRLDASTCYRYVPERRTASAEGEPISEWQTSIEALRLFVAE